MTSTPMVPGKSYRLLLDPSRSGVLTDRVRERAGQIHRGMKFADRIEFVPEDQLLPVEDDNDLVELVSIGRLGRASDLRRLLTHERLTGRLANLIYSLDATGTDFYAYQFKPVLKMLESVTSGLVVADEVGLGKTIEAGLVWTELRARSDVNRLLVLCPAVLRTKWQNELASRFGVDAQIANATEVQKALDRGIRHRDGSGFALVASIQGLRKSKIESASEYRELRPAARLEHTLSEAQGGPPLIDMLIIDEAHYLRNPETATWHIGQLLRDVSQYVLLLTATPIQLRNRDLFQLLHLADADTFENPYQFDQFVSANAPLVRARDLVRAGRASVDGLSDLLSQALAHPFLSGSRQVSSILSELPAETELRDPRICSELAYRIDRANLLTHVLNRTRRRDVTEWRVIRTATPEFIEMNAIEKHIYDEISSVVRDYADSAGGHEGFLLVTPQRQMASSLYAAVAEWRRRGMIESESDLDDDDDDANLSKSVGPLVGSIISHVRGFAHIDQLRANDTKFSRLHVCLRDLFEQERSVKVVLFSYFRPTLNYLSKRLTLAGFQAFLIHGGLKENLDTIERFRAADPPAILLSSDVGSEGLDLQFARLLINYDLPWNPMKVEQRIGRLDRLGQESPKISIWSLLHEDTIDSRIYTRLLARLGIFERALGGLEQVIGEEVRKLTIDLLRSNLTRAEEEERITQTAQAIENARRDEEELEAEAPQLVAFGDYILERVISARELSRRVDGNDLLNYATDFFMAKYPGSEFKRHLDQPDHVMVSLSLDAKRHLAAFILKRRLPATRLTEPSSGPTKCRFINNTSAAIANRLEVVNQFHPIIRFINEKIRNGESEFYRAVAVQVPKHLLKGRILEGIYAFAIHHWAMTGVQEIEKLAFAAGRLDKQPSDLVLHDDAEFLVTVAAAHGRDWLSFQSECRLDDAAIMINEGCLATLERAFEAFATEVETSNHDRAQVQLRTLESRYDRQRKSLEAILANQRQKGQQQIARATEGRMSALEQRTEMRRRDIGERMDTQHPKKTEICAGLIRVANDPESVFDSSP